MNARHQFIAMERLGDVIVRPEAEGTNLAVHFTNAREDQDRRLHLCIAQFLEHVIPVHIGQIQIKADDVIIIELAEIQALRSEEHTSELQSLMRISYAVFCLKKK